MVRQFFTQQANKFCILIALLMRYIFNIHIDPIQLIHFYIFSDLRRKRLYIS